MVLNATYNSMPTGFFICTILPSFWEYIQIFRGATFEGTKKMPELHFLHARSCTMLFFVNITGFNSNSSSDWTIKK